MVLLWSFNKFPYFACKAVVLVLLEALFKNLLGESLIEHKFQRYAVFSQSPQSPEYMFRLFAVFPALAQAT